MPDHGPESLDPAGQAIVEATYVGGSPVALVARVGQGLRIIWVSLSFQEVARRALGDLVDVDLATVITSPHGEIPFSESRATEFRANVVGHDGSTSSWDATATPTLDSSRRIWVVSLRPHVAHDDLDGLLRASEALFRTLADRAPIGIISSDVGLRLGYVNDSFAELLGVPAGRLEGTGWMSFVHEDDIDALCAGLQATLAGTPYESPIRLVTADGEQRWVNVRATPMLTPGAPAAFLATIEDVTERRRFEDVLSWQATHDPLTQLPNRSQLSTEIGDALDRGEEIAVLFLDLDDFKTVNDTYGHGAGDELLVTVATRLRTAVRDRDRVFRFGGDEFVVLADCKDDIDAINVAERLRAAVAQPVTVCDRPLSPQCSVGVVRPTPGASAADMLRDADAALYRAKDNGKGRIALYDAELREQRSRTTRLTSAVYSALEGRRLHLEYRPCRDLRTGRAVGVEALVRLSDPDWNDVDPAEIVLVAEQSAMSTMLTEAVVDQAVADLAAWRSAEAGPEWVVIPMSSAQLRSRGLANHIARRLVAHGLGGADVVLEISGQTWSSASEELLSAIEDLRGLGIRFLLDVVGDSDVSLSSLVAAPVMALKFDTGPAQSAGAGDDILVPTITRLAAELGLTVVGGALDTGVDVERARVFGIELGVGAALGHPTIAALVPSIFAAPAQLGEPTEP